MFDVGFSELLLISVVALIVIGPERLPSVARTLGHLMGRAQRYVNDVKSDINREMQLEELKKLQEEVTESARTLEQSMKGQLNQVQESLDEVSKEVELHTQPPSLESGNSPPLAVSEGTDSPVLPVATEAAAGDEHSSKA